MTTDLINKVISTYLYGTLTPPSNLVNEALIRADSATSALTLDASVYMTSGGGRFALPSQFEVVQKFFAADTNLAQGSYSLTDMLSQFSLNSSASRATIDQKQYSGGLDYLERVFIFNNTGFAIQDSAALRFVVDASGARHIENLKIIPQTDNFDFIGGDSITGSLNDAIRPFIDPSDSLLGLDGLGRKVILNFNDTAPVIGSYSQSEYIDDVVYIGGQKGPASQVLLEGPAFALALNDLWDAGITRFLDPENRPILYGSNGSDSITASQLDSIYNTGSVLTGIGTAFISDLLTYKGNGVVILSGAGADSLTGGDHNDKLDGGEGNDTLDGADGIDILYGGYGDDSMLGGEGNDQLFASVGNDTLDGGEGDDFLRGEEGYDALYGGYGNDTLSGGDGIDNLFGFAGDDLMYGSKDHDYIYGEDGNDSITGDTGGDQFFGGGDDTIDGGAGLDVIFGESGNDLIYGGADADLIYGDAGNDTLDGGAGNDYLFGDEGNDYLDGGAADDTVFGWSGDDTVMGGDGNDDVEGGSGNDQVYGGNGNDSVSGGGGVDVFYGGGGADRFGFTFGGATGDMIMDFAPGVDVIDVSGLGFIGIGLGYPPERAVSPGGGFLYINYGSGFTDIHGEGFSLFLSGEATILSTDFIFS